MCGSNSCDLSGQLITSSEYVDYMHIYRCNIILKLKQIVMIFTLPALMTGGVHGHLHRIMELRLLVLWIKNSSGSGSIWWNCMGRLLSYHRRDSCLGAWLALISSPWSSPGYMYSQCWDRPRDSRRARYIDLIIVPGKPHTVRQQHGHLIRYVKLRVTHAPGMPGTFSPTLTSKQTAS